MPTEPTNALTIHSALTDTSQREYVEKMLAELLITVSDQLFENRAIYIDGYRFINCSFVNCTLTVLRGTFEFHHCNITNSKRHFGQGAQKSIQFYAFSNNTLKASEGFGAKFHPDGSFSIAKGASST